MPLVACYFTTKMLASTVQFSRNGRAQLSHRKQSATKSGPLQEGVLNATDPSGPNSVLSGITHKPRRSTPHKRGCTNRKICSLNFKSMFHLAACRPHEHSSWTTWRLDEVINPRQWLLRKEVIQPHLPVRLPCYDLVLITGPTFDGSLHKGWATGFGCYRLS